MEESVLLCSSFSSDGKYLACGYSDGFAVYQCEKARRLFFRKFITGGIGLIEMVENSNLFLLVGGGMRPLFSPNQVSILWKHNVKVMIWDDAKARFVGEIIVGSKVLNLRVTKKLFVVVTINNVYVYNRDTLKVSEYSTVENSLGVIASNSECFVIPGQERGSLTVISHEGGIVHLKAHSNYLQSVYLADRGTLIATASEKGTLIRLYDIADGRKCQEFRRGFDKAAITLLCVSQDQKYLMCVTDDTVLSIFEISENSVSKAFVSLFTTESKPVASLSLQNEIKSIYICNASSIYVLTVTEVFMQFQLDDGLTLRYSAHLLHLCWNKQDQL